MRFNRHSNLEGRHAFLGASKYHWVNYDEEKLMETYENWLATQRGTELHDLASRAIRLGVRLPRAKKTLNLYVNDAISYGMTPELTLYYSDNCFGTADALSFDEEEGFLRVHDLKTGRSKTSMTQLRIYAALFCLEYQIMPYDIGTQLRIYQHDSVLVDDPDPNEIMGVMDKIVYFDRRIEEAKIGA